MAPIALASLSNPLVTSTQLIHFKNNATSATTSTHFAQALLTHSAGILLRLPLDVIAKAQVLLQRYQVSSLQPEQLWLSQEWDATTISQAVVYLTAKMSATPLSPRSAVNVYAYLTSTASPLWFVNPKGHQSDAPPDPMSYYVSEGTYEREKLRMFDAEAHVLSVLGFDTHVVLPHALALTYLQVLGVGSNALAARLLEHLNGGLSSPQLVYLTHQPNALAVAAIYLSARETGVKLVQENWWEVFDVDREDLGFLVLAFGSLSNFTEAERLKVLEDNKVPSLAS